VNVFIQKASGAFTGWLGDGPWRAKSILAALAVVIAGVGIWFHGLSSNPPAGETRSAITSSSVTTPSSTASTPAGSHRNWSKPFPFYVRMSASYVAGFCIGWFFRKLTRLILVVVALVVALLALGKFAGCDTTRMQEQVKRDGEWAQHETTTAENYLRHVLPSATTGGVGVFLGFRRRSKAGTSEPAA
jgi:uncharacterized membrane protein (Fun14 family)